MSATKMEVSEKKRLLMTILDWVKKNKKIFWKYEVSCFYETYKISIHNLPDPGERDISVSPNKKLLSIQQKMQLCDAVKNVCGKAGVISESYIDVIINCTDGGAVTAEIYQPG
jgi:hypothetical protein